MRIREMKADDIPFALQITEQEGWGYTEEDFVWILNMEPHGCFVALEDSKRIGMLTTTGYGRLAWIGNVVVDPERRGEGVGSSLVLHAVDYLKRSGVDNIGLYSYMDSIAFYEKIGFIESFRVSRLSGMRQGSNIRKTRKTKQEDLEAIIRLDKKYFPGDRFRLLKLALDRFPDSFFHACLNDEVVGYISGFYSHGAGEIGPWICRPEQPEVAKELLKDCLSTFGGKRHWLAIPNENRIAMRIAKEVGYRLDFEVAAMFLGSRRHHMNISGIFGVGSLEKG